MGDWPLLYEGQVLASLGADTSLSRGAAVTPSATANTKGSYAQLIASTATPTSGLWVFAAGPASSSADYLFDIAVGAAASEQIILANLKYDNWTTNSLVRYYFPIALASGVRLSARCQCTATSGGAISVYAMTTVGGYQQPYGIVDTYGAATADSGGTSIDPGGSANTKGSYSQIVSATARRHAGVVLAFGNQANSARTDARWLIDVAVGGAGSEQIVIPNYPLEASAAMDSLWPLCSEFIPVMIPSGVRVAARAQCTTTDATDRLFDLIAYGVS